MTRKTNTSEVKESSLALAMTIQFPSSRIYTEVINPLRSNSNTRNDPDLWANVQDVYSAWRTNQDTPSVRRSLAYLLNHLGIRSF